MTTRSSGQVADANDKAPVFTHSAPAALPEGLVAKVGLSIRRLSQLMWPQMGELGP